MSKSTLPIHSTTGARCDSDATLDHDCTIDGEHYINISLQSSILPRTKAPTSASTARSVIPLDSNWEFARLPQDEMETDLEYLPVSQFPTAVHLDLMHHGKIPDPYVGKNESDVQWIGESKWVYRTHFPTPQGVVNQASTDQNGAMLVFAGLDTFATVVLNGTTILEADNMFTPWEVPVAKYLRQGKDRAMNVLSITFDSAYIRGRDLVEKHPDHKWGCWNGDTSRLAVRKAQYHWGWDWGPTLLTCGPWRPVTLEIFESRITDLWCEVDVATSLEEATVIANATTDGSAHRIRFDLILADEIVDSKTTCTAQVKFELEKPQLWYPARYGKQTLYTVKAILLQDDNTVDTLSKRIGLRRTRLIQRPVAGQPGRSFFFEINNIPIFSGGTDWIPADSFFPRITRQRYYDWVKLAADGNQVMIRVWGGGIYEDPAFYETCDELGVLVWQDFMFACGNYPAYPDMLQAIKREAEISVRSLRHHPCIVLFAGNNEDYSYAESESLEWNQDDPWPQNWLKTDFPARYIYEKILPDVCKELCPSIDYHPGSPWGGSSTSDNTVGDIHQWNVWHGTQEKYQNFDKLWGRFVSEFGMEAFPDIRTIDAFLPLGAEDPDRYAQSATVDFHNKAEGHERRLALYMAENLRYSPEPLDQYVYSTQLMQSECLSSAYRAWKRLWKGPGKEYCSGALAWQLNDSWPGTSWAIVDYYLRPKLSYYTIKRELAMMSLGLARITKTSDDDGSDSEKQQQKVTEIEIWATNLGPSQAGPFECTIQYFDVETGKEIQVNKKDDKSNLFLPPSQSTELDVVALPPASEENPPPDSTVILVNLLSNQGNNTVVVARYVNWPEPLKYVHLARPKELRAELSEDGQEVEVSAEVPVKGAVIGVVAEEEGKKRGDEVKFGDNNVDLVPGEVVRIPVYGAEKGMRFGVVRYLGMDYL